MAITIVTREQWGARYARSSNRVALSSRRFFVCHWPGSSGAITNEAATVRAIEQQHFNQGWSARPGYNFLVGQSGTIFEGAGRDVQGVHCPGRNTDGFGVCILQPTTARLTDAARRSTRALYDELCRNTNRALGQTWHGAHFATACPGNEVIAWVRSGMPSPGGSTPKPEPEPEPEPEIPVSEATLFIRSRDTYEGTTVRIVRYAVWDGPRTYWRRLRQGMIGDVERAGIPIIDDPNNSWLGDWRDGAPA